MQDRRRLGKRRSGVGRGTEGAWYLGEALGLDVQRQSELILQLRVLLTHVVHPATPSHSCKHQATVGNISLNRRLNKYEGS